MRSVLTALCLAICVSGAADDLVLEHGAYSASYQSDWRTLPTGRELGAHDPAAYDFREVAGEDVRLQFLDQQEVKISGERLRVSWQDPGCDKYRHTLYYFRNCAVVRICSHAGPGYFHVMHCRDGPTYFRNCLLHSRVPLSDLHESMGETPDQGMHLLRPDWFVYLMPERSRWLWPRTGSITGRFVAGLAGAGLR